ncbi:MAG TPA: serine protein kinase PrkA [Candidatus Kapabacteria bacterium]|nr:serine protein kinase PrkA [Candidatus Kapabacteria bacterium]
METFIELQKKAKKLETLIKMSNAIVEREKRIPVPFNDFLYFAAINPRLAFRDIFQLFHDMVHNYVPEGTDEIYDAEHIGFVDYNTKNLFRENLDSPFFADRLFANRLMNLTKTFAKGTQKNRIYIFEGPPGSGKSTFLNNILNKFEEYSKTPEGISFKTYWRLDIEKLGGFHMKELQQFKHAEQSKLDTTLPQPIINMPEKYLEFSCPNHDHPILQIPKEFRRDFLEELIPDEEFKNELFNDKQYEWVLKDTPCAICNSITRSLLERLKDPIEVFSMLSSRRNYFNRQLGEGVSVFNPGDPKIDGYLSKPALQYMINDILKHDEVKYTYSYLAKTNNGILALMDIKEYNVDRLKAYHGIISDGVHKVELTEEKIKTLFIGLVNPEDKIHYEEIKSFQDRIISVQIPYILDYNTEVAIYQNKYGTRIKDKFLNNVLENFAKVIIATRLNNEAPAIRKWIKRPELYNKYLDKNLMLLKMQIYIGKLPEWLNEEDIKNFDREVRKEIILYSENEGQRGISGRKSLSVFNEFLSKYENSSRLITMDDIKDYFENKKDDLNIEIPADFIDKLIDLYDYGCLQRVKDSLYSYNEKHITDEIINYLFAINYEVGDTKKSTFNEEVIEITEELLNSFEIRILGADSTTNTRKLFRKDSLNEYISQTLSQEIRVNNKAMNETKQFKTLFEKYIRNLKEDVLAPYINNDNFRRAILDFGGNSFHTYDERIKRDVTILLSNLQSKYEYSEVGAKQVSLYVLDKKIDNLY